MAFVNYKIKDNAIGQLLTSVTTGATSITLKSGEWANFPSLWVWEKFLAVLVQYDWSGFNEANVVKRERVIATARSGDTVTITRWDESDTPLAFDADDYFICTWRAKDVQDMKDEIERLETDKLDIADYQNWDKVYAGSSTGTDAYAITLSPAITAYQASQVFKFQADVWNTGPATLNVNGLWAKTIKKRHDLDLETWDIEAWQIVTVSYDGTNFQMDSQLALIPSVDIDSQTEDTTWDMDSDYLIKSDWTNKKILVNKYRSSDWEATAWTVTNKFITPKQVKDNYDTTYFTTQTTRQTSDVTWTQNIAHGKGKAPEIVRFKFAFDIAVTAWIWNMFSWSYDWTTNRCLWCYDAWATVDFINSSTYCIQIDDGSGWWTATCTVDSTNITISWTKSGSPTNDVFVLIEAEF